MFPRIVIMNIRKNRLLQVIFTLLLLTVAFPIVINLIDNQSDGSGGTRWNALFASDANENGDMPPELAAQSAEYRQHVDHLARSVLNLLADGEGREVSEELQNRQQYVKKVAGSSLDLQLAYRFEDLANRVRHAEMMAAERKHEIYRLLQEIRYLWSINNITANGNNESEGHHLPDNTAISRPITHDSNLTTANNRELLHLPSLLSLMPFLNITPDTSFNPVFRIAPNERKNVRFVFGIPTVKRVVESYLISTITNLISNLSPAEQNQTCLVVLIAETDIDFVRKTAHELETLFKPYVESGLLEIISPPAEFYPKPETLKITLNDSKERVKWRSKQNFDFAYLMMYCQSKGTYYVQLEDDIISKPNYLQRMETFLAKTALKKQDWIILDFCALGFIGKMFKTVDLSKFILFFVMFYNDKPVDWLVDNFIQTKMCRLDKDSKDCRKMKQSVWLVHKPSLFQHVGTHSSLKGKIQKLRDKGFGTIRQFEPHQDNPPTATIHTTIKQYKHYSLIDAYEGLSFFWGWTPIAGDVIEFTLEQPTDLERCYIRSGNYEHPEDRFYNAALLVKPTQALSRVLKTSYKQSTDGFISLGECNPLKGSFDVDIPDELNPIETIRIVNNENSTHWLILSEIYLKAKNNFATTNNY